MIRNNQNGRRRGRGGARPPQQGGGPSGNYSNNNGGGSRIDTRQRGNATQLLEKYKAMARDATQNGDRVQAEFYMQYADHYFRVLNEFRARDPQPAPRSTYDDDDDAYGAPGVGRNYMQASERDEDDGDEAGAANGSERQAYRANGERPRGNDSYPQQGERTSRDNRDAGRQQGYTARAGGDENRGDAQRGDTQRGDAQRGDAQRGDAQRSDVQRRDDGRAEASQRFDGQVDAVPNDGNRGGNGEARDTTRRDDTRDGEREFVRRAAPRYAVPRDASVRESGSREAEPRDAAVETVIGLPGRATVATASAPATPATEDIAVADMASVAEPATPVATDGDVPVRRPRGRPRKVVVADSVDS